MKYLKLKLLKYNTHDIINLPLKREIGKHESSNLISIYPSDQFKIFYSKINKTPFSVRISINPEKCAELKYLHKRIYIYQTILKGVLTLFVIRKKSNVLQLTIINQICMNITSHKVSSMMNDIDDNDFEKIRSTNLRKYYKV